MDGSQTEATDIKLPDLFSHLNSLSGSYHANWNIYTVVVLGLLTFVATTEGKVKLDEVIGLFVIVGLGIFLITNFLRIRNIEREINVVAGELKKMLTVSKAGSEFKDYYNQDSSRTNSGWKYFHALVDVSLISSLIYKVYCS